MSNNDSDYNECNTWHVLFCIVYYCLYCFWIIVCTFIVNSIFHALFSLYTMLLEHWYGICCTIEIMLYTYETILCVYCVYIKQYINNRNKYIINNKQYKQYRLTHCNICLLCYALFTTTPLFRSIVLHLFLLCSLPIYLKSTMPEQQHNTINNTIILNTNK